MNASIHIHTLSLSLSLSLSPSLTHTGLHYIHRAVMVDLKPDTVYWYNVSVDSRTSRTFATRTPPAASDYTLRVLVFGDMVSLWRMHRCC